ncbi:hypothetical protein BC831DRAFT_438285 [Entophlyctis helioformis]|nr:hypothetical protein BC831DRAFT_438285 [Entophlyctis helioformis]
MLCSLACSLLCSALLSLHPSCRCLNRHGEGKTKGSAFPKELAALTGLKEIYLVNNKYTLIPDGVFANLTELEALYLFGNKFGGKPIVVLGRQAGLPAGLGAVSMHAGERRADDYFIGRQHRPGLGAADDCKNGGNQSGQCGPTMSVRSRGSRGSRDRDRASVTPIPLSIGNFPRLTQLSLYNAGFGGEIPASFQKLTNLESLSIDTNNLSGTLPSWFSNLNSLGSFDFYDNPLLEGPLPDFAESIRDCDGAHTNVCVPESHKGPDCYIENNPCCIALPGSDCAILQDIIPSVFDKYSDCCKVAGVACDADNCATKLLLPTKSITGQLSVKISGLTKLQELDLSNNAIEGSLPDVFDKLTSFTSLNISGNTGMDGTLPGFPVTLKDCKGTNTGICVPQDVTLAQTCGVTKDCPYTAPAGSDCAGLQQLLPFIFAGKSCCKVLGTECNKDGRVTSIIKPGPKKTGKRNVASIITGPFPDLGNLTYLERIDFSNNDIEGPLSDVFDKLTLLTSLNISGNTSMDGTLPGFPATLTDCKGTDTGICVPAGLTGTDCGIETKSTDARFWDAAEGYVLTTTETTTTTTTTTTVALGRQTGLPAGLGAVSMRAGNGGRRLLMEQHRPGLGQ